MIAYLYELNENITSFFVLDSIQFVQHFLFKMSMLEGFFFFFPSVKWKNNFVSFFILLLFFVF